MTTAPAINIYQFNDFYKKNQRALFKFIFNMTRDAMVSEELVDDTFMKVHNSMHMFDEAKSSFRTWVYNIASNATIDYIRKKKIQTVSMNGVLQNDDGDNVQVMDFASDEENPLEQFISGESRNKISDAMEQLSESQATMLKYVIDGYNYQDIADELEIPLGTVKGSIHQARVRMKEIFGKVPATV